MPDSDPSSSNRHTSRRRTRASASSARVTWRCARANRSSWLAVIGPASSASPASVAGVAIRVSARTLAYDSFAAANRARITGRSRSARATRTCSRAVPDDIWHFHDSHCAQEPISQLSPAAAGVEVGQQDQEPAGRRGQVPGQLADLRLQPLQRSPGRLSRGRGHVGWRRDGSEDRAWPV